MPFCTPFLISFGTPWRLGKVFSRLRAKPCSKVSAQGLVLRSRQQGLSCTSAASSACSACLHPHEVCGFRSCLAESSFSICNQLIMIRYSPGVPLVAGRSLVCFCMFFVLSCLSWRFDTFECLRLKCWRFHNSDWAAWLEHEVLIFYVATLSLATKVASIRSSGGAVRSISKALVAIREGSFELQLIFGRFDIFSCCRIATDRLWSLPFAGVLSPMTGTTSTTAMTSGWGCACIFACLSCLKVTERRQNIQQARLVCSALSFSETTETRPRYGQLGMHPLRTGSRLELPDGMFLVGSQCAFICGFGMSWCLWPGHPAKTWRTKNKYLTLQNINLFAKIVTCMERAGQCAVLLHPDFCPRRALVLLVL